MTSHQNLTVYPDGKSFFPNVNKKQISLQACYDYFILCYRYGLQEFLVITPSQTSAAIDSESRAKILLSSVSIALNNTGR
jgi:hypothetical protein